MLMKIDCTSDGFSASKITPCKDAVLINNRWYVQINTIEDAIKIKEEVGTEIILTGDSIHGYGLEIYDNYRE